MLRQAYILTTLFVAATCFHEMTQNWTFRRCSFREKFDELRLLGTLFLCMHYYKSAKKLLEKLYKNATPHAVGFMIVNISNSL